MVPNNWYQTHILSADGWYKDSGQTATLTTTDAGYNTGFVARRKKIKTGGAIEFCVPLHNDVITCTRHLPPGYRLEINLTRMPDDFVIWMATTNKFTPAGQNAVPELMRYQIKLSELRVSVKKTRVEDRIFNHYYNGLSKIPAIPFTRNMIRSYTKLLTDIFLY